MLTNRDDFGIAIRSALLQRGAKQKFSLFFLICFSILIFFFDSFSNTFVNTARSILKDGVYKVSSISSSPIRFLNFIQESTKNIYFVHDENKNLKKEIIELKSKGLQVDYLKTENKKLKQFLNSEKIENNTFLTAKVFLDKKSPFLKSVIVNRGSKSGIKIGMPVLDNNYLVGRIVEVNYFSSRVLLLNDLNSRIPIVIEESAEQAILTGTGKSEPKLEYLPDLFVSSANKTVYTSGKDGVFSSGIPIGKTKIKDNEVTVDLFSDLNQLSFINIVPLAEDEAKF
jgi:rod shape-determining protein MreC